MQRALLFLVGAAATALAATAGGCTDAKHRAPGRVHDEDQGFSIVPPAGWRRLDRYGSSFLTFEGLADAGGPARLTVVAERDPKASIGTLAHAARSALAKFREGFAAEEEGFTEIESRPCYRLVGRFTKQDRPMKILHYVLRSRGRKVYYLSFVAPAACFDANRPAFEESARSARID